MTSQSPATISYPNTTTETWDYYQSNRVKTILTAKGGTTILQFDYQYDANGNRLTQDETRLWGNGTGTVRQSQSLYSYDTLDRMTSYSVTENSATTKTDYTFEGYNRKTETTTKPGNTASTKTYTYDETDWLTQIADGTKTISYSYDLNGNTVSKTDSNDPTNPIVFEYDARDKLTKTSKGATLLGRYSYNASGYRTRQIGSDRGDVDYYYDGTAVVEERNAGGLLAHYRYAGKLFSLTDGTSSQYYHQDALGSTTDLTDDTGATKASYFLNPWGMIVDSIGNSVNRRIFTGKETDTNTGLIYFGARYYDADTARFTTQDSYLGKQDEPPSLHRYLYAYSNPTVYVDLEGYLSLDNHVLTTGDAFDEAVKKGYFVPPKDKSAFRENMQIGSMYPDLQSEYAAEAIYYKKSFDNVKVFGGSRLIRKGAEIVEDDVKKPSRGWLQEGLKKIAPKTYITIEKYKHAWDDSDMKAPAIEKAAEYFPSIKGWNIARTHFYDKQWQHGMGEDTPKTRENLIEDTLKRVAAYKEHMANGDTAKAGKELGIVMHYLEDTWTPSHVARDSDGKIKYMYDYTKQSPKLHGEQDKPHLGSATLRNATKAGVEFLRIIQQYGDDPKMLNKQLSEKVYPLDYDKNYPNPYAPREVTAPWKGAVDTVKDRVNGCLPDKFRLRF